MLPTEELFVYVYVLVHDLIRAGSIAIPSRPGPAPACTDAELLAIAEVRHLLGRRSGAGFLAEVARDRGHLFPVLPCQSEANRRTRWLWATHTLRAHPSPLQALPCAPGLRFPVGHGKHAGSPRSGAAS
jgi:hypothetical protein